MKATTYAPTDEIRCPNCAATIGYYHFSSMGNLCPHFYCTDCSNVFFRESDFLRIRSKEASQSLLEEIAGTLPDCPCGGRFSPGSNPKCPECRAELRHRDSPIQRLHDPHAIVLEKSALFTEE